MGRERRVDQKKKIRRTGRKWKREGWRHTQKHRKHGGEEERAVRDTGPGTMRWGTKEESGVERKGDRG